MDLSIRRGRRICSMVKVPLPCPAIELIPHRESMLFLKELREYNVKTAASMIRVEHDNLFLNYDKSLNPMVFVEMAAQLIASHSGYKARLDNAIPKIGYLVGLKDFVFHDVAHQGDELAITVQEELEFGSAHYVHAKVSTPKSMLAEGVLKIWETERISADEHPVNAGRHPERPITEFSWGGLAPNSQLHEEIAPFFISLHVERANGRAKAKLNFPERFIGFQGHFPGMPILPGIMMLHLSMMVTELLLEEALICQQIVTAKFSRQVFPRQELGIEIETAKEGQTYPTRAKLTLSGEKCAEFAACFSPLSTRAVT